MTFRSCGYTPVALRFDVGIAICATDVARQRMHVGLIYRNSEGRQRFLHLAFHHDLRDEEPPSEAAYFWSDCLWLEHPDAELNREALATFAESVKAEAEIPYGFDASGIHFDGGGHFISLDPTNGLTCATFIASLFESAGFPVVDLTTWELRGDDEAWRADILGLLRRLAPSRAEEVSESQVEFRLRPDEIAGASCHLIVPAAFHEAVGLAQPIRDLIFQPPTQPGPADQTGGTSA